MESYQISELEGLVDLLRDHVVKLARAEARSWKRDSDLAIVIRGWRIILEALHAEAIKVVETANEHGMFVARQQACMLEKRAMTVYHSMDQYRPVSTGYERLLLTLVDTASRMCRG